MIRSTIALKIPYAKNPDECFSFRLQPNLQKESSEFNSVDKLLILANLNGDFDYLRKILINTGVIDRKYHWTFDNGHLVILGNCLDMEQKRVECLWFIYSLEERARRKGGYVHYILGDTEIKNINGEWSQTHPHYITSKKYIRVPIVALYDANSQLRKWLYTKNIIEKIGKMIFVSISFKLPFNEFGISDLNRIAGLNYANFEMFNNKIEMNVGSKNNKIYPLNENPFILELKESVLIPGNMMVLKENNIPYNRLISFSENPEESKSLFYQNGNFFWINSNGTIGPLIQ